jgi:hypothetical protein
MYILHSYYEFYCNYLENILFRYLVLKLGIFSGIYSYVHVRVNGTWLGAKLLRQGKDRESIVHRGVSGGGGAVGVIG